MLSIEAVLVCHGDDEMATTVVRGWRLLWWWQSWSFLGHSETTRNCMKTCGNLIHWKYEARILPIETLKFNFTFYCFLVKQRK